jgi:hypothetical protein
MIETTCARPAFSVVKGERACALVARHHLLTLTADERQMLERWTRGPSTAQAQAQRARLILSCAAGKTNTWVAQEPTW